MNAEGAALQGSGWVVSNFSFTTFDLNQKMLFVPFALTLALQPVLTY